MEIITAHYTDAGETKKVNQDALFVKVVNSPKGKIVFALVCDGMGGLAYGELASKEIVVAFRNWFHNGLIKMVEAASFSKEKLYSQWNYMVKALNRHLKCYAKRYGKEMGSTLSLLLVYQGNYYICHVGDSRIYWIRNGVKQITTDQTVVAMEMETGKLTLEEARKDPRRSILLQCIGASEQVCPQFESGRLDSPGTFLLVSDGLVHTISENELYESFSSEIVENKEKMTEACGLLVQTARKRGEQDNITMVAVALKNGGGNENRHNHWW